MTRTSSRALWVSLVLFARGVSATQSEVAPRRTDAPMDLDKMLAEMQAAAGTVSLLDGLITTDLYVPVDSDNPAADRGAARQMVAAFAFWLVEYERVAPDVPPARAAILSSIV